MSKYRFNLDSAPLPFADNRTDTTRKGYSEKTIPYGAGNTWAGAFPLDAIFNSGSHSDPRSDYYNPLILTGTAPTPFSLSKGSSVIDALNKVKAIRAAKLAAQQAAKAQKAANLAKRSEALRQRMLGNKLGGSAEAITKAKATRIANGTTQSQIGAAVKERNYNNNFKHINTNNVKVKGGISSTSSAKGSYYNKKTITANDYENLLFE